MSNTVVIVVATSTVRWRLAADRIRVTGTMLIVVWLLASDSLFKTSSRIAPRRPPVDLSAPLPSSTSPPVFQADLQALLAAIDELRSRLYPDMAGDGQRGPRRGSLAVPDSEELSGLTGMIEAKQIASKRCREGVQAVIERMAGNNGTIDVLGRLLKPFADSREHFPDLFPVWPMHSILPWGVPCASRVRVFKGQAESQSSLTASDPDNIQSKLSRPSWNRPLLSFHH